MTDRLEKYKDWLKYADHTSGTYIKELINEVERLLEQLRLKDEIIKMDNAEREK